MPYFPLYSICREDTVLYVCFWIRWGHLYGTLRVLALHVFQPVFLLATTPYRPFDSFFSSVTSSLHASGFGVVQLLIFPCAYKGPPAVT
ncbi:hypothetical protein AMK09_38080 [Streptomyces sp. CB02488]|nr:hypothetical protein AMK09_38080 [Streptomyces sp. CB02488]